MLRVYIHNIARFVAAIIMLQTLYYKFTGSEESVYIFTTVGLEPVGRWLVGILELVASVLLFIPRGVWKGAVLGASLMFGAVVMHLTVLGIEVMSDGGYLFMLGLIVLFCCLYLIILDRNEIKHEIFKKK